MLIYRPIGALIWTPVARSWLRWFIQSGCAIQVGVNAPQYNIPLVYTYDTLRS